jgi:hypothetical protein
MLPSPPRAAVLAGTLVIAASTAALVHREMWSPPAGFGEAAAADPATRPAAAPTRGSTARPRPETRPEAPVSVSVASLAIAAPVVRVTTLASGELAVPDDVSVIGWWDQGLPAQRIAARPTLLVGHVDSARLGRGAFFSLRQARPGAVVQLRFPSGIRRYRVFAMRVYDKRALPSSLLAPSAQPVLLLVTCGGPFDPRTHHYRDNVVVFARLIS